MGTKCFHCGREITNTKYMWSRGGIHWCNKSCYEQDNYPNLVEDRKKKSKENGKRKKVVKK